MKLLAIETSTQACSVALSIGGEIAERYQLAPRKHTKLVLPMINSLLSEAGLSLQQLDALALGRGPGSFTGIRIASSVAQGLALGADLPVVTVSSLLTLAQTAFDDYGDEHVLTCLDARMGDVYYAACCLGVDKVMQFQLDEYICKLDAIHIPNISPPNIPHAQSWLAVGDGWSLVGAHLKDNQVKKLCSIKIDCYPKASAVAELATIAYAQGQARPAEFALPVYLREMNYKKQTSA